MLHHSLASLHADHSRYNREVEFLANYSLNNGMLIAELASARVADGVSILTLLNSTQLISGKLHSLQMDFLQVCDA